MLSKGTILCGRSCTQNSNSKGSFYAKVHLPMKCSYCNSQHVLNRNIDSND